MKYIVTGATSFLGQALIRRLLRQGHYVVAVCRSDSPHLRELPPGAEIVVADMDSYSGLYRDVEQADVWVHLAWEGTTHDRRDDTDVQQANVINTIGAMYGASKMGCRLFVGAGSQAEYGSVANTITELTPCHPFTAYGRAKLEAGRRLALLAPQLAMKYLHLRIFSLIGEGDHPWTLVMSGLRRMLANEPVDLSLCRQQWNFLDVGDAARQVAALCDYAVRSTDFTTDVYHIAAGDSRPLHYFVERMKLLTDSASQLNYGAVKPANIVALMPDVSKTATVVSPLCEHTFDDTIIRIISTMRHDKGQ